MPTSVCSEACFVHPFFKRVARELGDVDQLAIKQMLVRGCNPRLHSYMKMGAEAPAELGPWNQDGQHKLNQPRESFSGNFKWGFTEGRGFPAQ